MNIRTLTRRLRGPALVTLATGLLVLFTTGPAAAVSSQVDDSRTSGGALTWINVKDSYGVKIWKFALDLDEGGITSPGKAVWATLVNLVFNVYKLAASLALWLIDWVLSLDWLLALTHPITVLGDAMSQLVTRFGVGPTLLSATGLLAIFWMARGAWARGIYELGMSAVIFALAAGIFAHPVQMIAGRDGAVVKANELGLEVSSVLQDSDAADGSMDELRKQQSARLADVFVSDPFQVVNFGAVLSKKCERVYETAVDQRQALEGIDIDGFKLRDIVKNCDKQAGEWASNPGPEMFMSALVFIPASGAVLLLALMVAGAVLVAGFTALFLSIKLIWDLLQALGPSGLRSGLWSSIAETVMALAMVVFTSAFLGGLLTFLEYVFTSGAEDGDASVQTFAIADVVLVVGCIVFWRWRQKVKAAAERLKQALASRPGGPLPATQRAHSLPPIATNAMRAAHLMQLHRVSLTSRRTPSSSTAGPEAPPAPSGSGGTQRVDAQFGSPSSTSTAPPRISTPARKRLTAGGMDTGLGAPLPKPPGGLGTAISIGAAAMTGGTSAVALQAARAAARRQAAIQRSPQRAQLAAKLASPSPSPVRYDRVVRNGQTLYVPRKEA